MLIREIEANFPDYTQILPKDEPLITLTCSERELRDKLGVAVLYARHSALLVRVEINQDTLTLLVNAADVGDSDSGVPITTYVSDPTQVEWPVRLGLNGRMLGEGIRAAASLNPTDGDRIAIRIWAPERPIVIVPADSSPLSPFLVVQMPMHLTR